VNRQPSGLETIRQAATEPLVRAARQSPQWGVIVDDLARWRELRYYQADPPLTGDDERLRYFLVALPEFRNLLYYRLERGGHTGALVAKAARRVWRPVATLDLSCPDIGPGLVIRHGYSTILTAERIGADCFVHHEVTIGWDDEGARAPVLGRNVYVGAGAKVLGAITIGDDVRIGANAVVLGDVPDGCTAVGVPARIVEGRRASASHR
jgi:serine O-acetyltransferase